VVDTFAWTVTNPAPVAGDDSATVAEDSLNNTIAVLGNDVDEDTLTVTLASALNGTVLINGDNTLDYTPNPNFFGADVISYTVDDGEGGTDTAVVNVTVTPVNDDPAVNANTGSTVNEGAADVVLQGELEYTDPEEGPANVTFTVNTAPVNGQLLRSGVPTASFTQADINAGIITYQHDGSETAGDSFTFTVTDGVGGSIAGQSFTFTVTAVNDAPVNTIPGPLNTGLNTPIVFSGANLIAVSDIDAGVAPIQVDLVVGGGNGTLTLATTAGIAIGPGADGTSAMTLTGTLAAINAALDGMTFTPNLAFQGATSVQISTDDLGNLGLPGPQTDIDTITITVTNTAPTMADQTITVDENSALGALVGAVVATDPDLLDPLAYTILSGNTGGAFSIDPATGQLRVANPALLDFETTPTFTLQVQVTDSGTPGLSDTAFVTIQLNDLIGALDPTDPISGGDPDPDPSPDPDPDPAPTGGGDDGGDDEIDLGGDDGGGGNPTPEPEPEPQPAPVIVIGSDVDAELPGPVSGQTEPAPIVERESTRFQVTQSDKLDISAETQDTSRPADHTIVFSEAVDIMSEGVGTTDILEEVVSNPLQATFKGGSFALSAGFLTWALRGASLVASMAAAMPAWQGFDPLPVLAAKKRDKKTDKDEQQEDDWQEKRIRRLLDPVKSADEE